MSVTTTVKAKNPCAKSRPKENPYEVWTDGFFVWRVLKKYQIPEKEAVNKYARWFVFATSPVCPEGEYGDTYVSEIKSGGRKVS